MSNAYGVKYLLGIIDVFSRKGMIYKQNDKKSVNFIPNILEFCVNNSFTKEFVSYNVPEFKNALLKEIYEKEKIVFIHGIPYNPHTQGTIEKFYYTIKKYLGKEFINNGYKALNFDSVRIRVINFYNNKVHRMIGMTPNESSKLTLKEDILKVNEIKKRI